MSRIKLGTSHRGRIISKATLKIGIGPHLLAKKFEKNTDWKYFAVRNFEFIQIISFRAYRGWRYNGHFAVCPRNFS